MAYLAGRRALGRDSFFGTQKIQIAKYGRVVLLFHDPAASATWIVSLDFTANFHDDLAAAVSAGAVCKRKITQRRAIFGYASSGINKQY
jgi:hypothetical protein